ncbi:hypothetical protein M5D96_003114, partial [Drosophila gunungcola]
QSRRQRRKKIRRKGFITVCLWPGPRTWLIASAPTIVFHQSGNVHSDGFRFWGFGCPRIWPGTVCHGPAVGST